MSRLVPILLIATALSSGCKDQRPADQTSGVMIFGGQPAQAGDPLAAFTAALGRGDGEVTCSAVLISPQVLVTAAHCLRPDYMVDRPFVAFGLDVKTARRIAVKSYAIHPDYDPAFSGSSIRSQYDIGLIAIAQPAPDTNPVVMLDKSATPIQSSTLVKIAGYGTTDRGRNDAGILRYAPTSILSESGGTQEIFVDGFRVTNACGGDSGGPALVQDQAGRSYLLGVASYVIPYNGRDCNSGFSSYSDVRVYKPWIDVAALRLPQLDGKVEFALPTGAPTGSTTAR